MQLEQLSEQMKTNGIVGAGGAGFPSYAKLNRKAQILILNCAECEPLLKLHRQLLEKYAYEILTALDTVAKAVEAQHVYIGVKASYSKTVEAVRAVLPGFQNFSVSLLPEVYPSGDEVVLTYEVTGRVVPPGEIPISQGVIVYNVETMLNLYYALQGIPVTAKYVTVAGCVAQPQTVRAPLGITFRELVELAGGVTAEDAVLISGGPMTGKIASLYDVVTKTTNAILVLPEKNPAVQQKKNNTGISMKRAMSSCCQCQMCTDLCPRHLLGHPIAPHLFMRAASTGVVQQAQGMLDTLYCCGCGVCELYACPQGLHPKSLIEEYKARLRSQGIRPGKREGGPVKPQRPYRQVPVERLVARLGLSAYDVPAPLMEKEVSAKRVKVLLQQHIGAPAQPQVQVGDQVEKNGKIACCTGLGADIHAPVSGRVDQVGKDFILIKAQ